MPALGEFDTAASDTVAGEIAGASMQAPPPAARCRNCDAALKGGWCHVCGQKAEDFHRSVRRLIAEAFEGLTNFDGRFWSTAARLLVKPGRLTRDYLDGKRASQIPPFRLFLVVLLIVFFSGGVGMGERQFSLGVIDPAVQQNMTPEQRAHVQAGIPKIIGSGWLGGQVMHAIENQDAFFRAMEHWSQRFAILMLPLAALLLSALFAFRKEVYVFDHLIFAMHSLSFQGLLLAVVLMLGAMINSAWVLAAAPIHLFVHMRGAYGTGRLGTLVRMGLLFAGTAIGFGFLMAGLALVGLATAR